MNDAPAGMDAADGDVPYIDNLTVRMTPDRMAATALYRGWAPPDPQTASFLEIGGARCINAIAVAAAHPQTRCVGFDLSGPAIENGRALAAAAGLANVKLQQADILSFPREGERFDYIACHGVFTWVPQPVREAILDLIAARLAPGGIAYIGYDCLPAAAGKAEVVRLLLDSVGHIPDIAQRVDTAMQTALVLARNQQEHSRLKPMLDQLMTNAPRFPRNYVYHDWLIEAYAPVSLADVVAGAGRRGLAFAGDAALYDLSVAEFDADAQGLIAAAGGDLVRRNTVMDLLRGTHSYRADLFVRADAPPRPRAHALRDLAFAFSGAREAVEEEPGAIRYSNGASRATSRDPGVHQVMAALAAAAPAELSYEQLRAATGVPEAELDRILADNVVMMFAEAHATVQPFVTAPGDRPRASPLVRAMLAHGEETVSLRHERMTLTDPVMRLILVLANGTRTDADIAAGITEIFGARADAPQVRAAIGRLARQRLFAA